MDSLIIAAVAATLYFIPLLVGLYLLKKILDWDSSGFGHPVLDVPKLTRLALYIPLVNWFLLYFLGEDWGDIRRRQSEARKILKDLEKKLTDPQVKAQLKEIIKEFK